MQRQTAKGSQIANGNLEIGVLTDSFGCLSILFHYCTLKLTRKLDNMWILFIIPIVIKLSLYDSVCNYNKGGFIGNFSSTSHLSVWEEYENIISFLYVLLVRVFHHIDFVH